MNLLPSQRTKYTRNEDIKKKWVVIDAKGQVLGRLASQIAYRLRGKHRVDFSEHQDIGDHVVVINAKEIAFTGKKTEQKVYYKHSNHPGGLSIASLAEKMERDPVFALQKAVQRMLPKGALGRRLINHLKVYPQSTHPHAAQSPKVLESTKK